VNDPLIKRVRESVTAVGDPAITEDQAHIDVDLQDGRTFSKFVAQSLGNIQRPLSNHQLEEKLRNQAVTALTAQQVDRLIELCWSIDELADVNTLVKIAIPEKA
jgi:2-methylcitrate dehydratase PrpD